MSPTPEPRPGFYVATSCGTLYEATKDKKGVWRLLKLKRGAGRYPPQPFEKPDFPASVNAGIFKPETA